MEVNDRWNCDNTPMNVTSSAGHTNILTISDERSCYILAAVATETRDAAELTGHISDALHMHGPPKALRSDNEFSQSTAYRQLLRDHRVRLESTAPYSPEQNGSAEQRQTALTRIIRSWMYESKMPHHFWHYAVDCAAERLNMTLVQRNTGETIQPYETFHGGDKPVLLFPESWGALCFVTLRPEQCQGKLDANGAKAVFLGRAPGTAAALVMFADGRTTVTTDVVFPKTYQPGGLLFQSSSDSPSPEAAAAAAAADALHTSPDPSWMMDDDDHSNDDADELEDLDDHDSSYQTASGHEEETRGPSIRTSSEREDQRASTSFSYSDSDAEHAPDTPVTTTRSGRSVRTPSDFSKVIPHALVASKALVMHNRSAINRPDEQAERPDQPVYYFAESPGTVKDVLKCQQPERYWKALDDEWQGLIDNKVFSPVALPPGTADALPLYSFFTDKMDADGNWIKSKCRTVARGDRQNWWQYFNTTASVLAIQHFRLFIALASSLSMRPWMVDITQAFLHTDLDETIYVKVTDDILQHLPSSLATALQDIRRSGGRPGLRLLKTLYGLKQGPHNWTKHLDQTLKSYGLKQMVKSPSLWTLRDPKTDDLLLLVCTYVDDIGFASCHQAERQRFVDFLRSKYKVGLAEEMTSYIGIKVHTDATTGDIHLSQPGHIRAALDRFHMTNCSTVDTPMVPHQHDLKSFCPEAGSKDELAMRDVPYAELAGLLNYLSVTTRPDIAIAVRQISKFMRNPGPQHWKMAKRVLAYLKGTSTMGLTFQGGSPVVLYGHSDSSHAEDKEHSRSTSGFLTMLAGAPINWGVKLQDDVSISTAESEFYGLYYLTLDVVGFRELLQELGFPQDGPTVIDCDNQSAISWAYGKGRLSCQKHIRLKYHFVQDAVRTKDTEVHYLETYRMPADFLTKVLGRELFQACRDSVMTLPNRRTSQLPVQGGVKVEDSNSEVTSATSASSLSQSYDDRMTTRALKGNAPRELCPREV